MHIDASFPVVGDLLPADSHYLLYAALSRAVPAFHDPASRIRFGPIGGEIAGKGLIRLTATSRLRVRLPAEGIGLVIPLTGQTLRLGEHAVRLQVPTVQGLTPASTLIARVVTFKHAQELPRFLEIARQKLDSMGIAAEPGVPAIANGPRNGEPRRKVVRIKERQVIGYTLQVSGLTAEESLRLQETGLGGRSRMGCGFFVPFRAR